MSCNGNVESGIVGVAYDGFPFYGPMQYYSGELIMSHMIWPQLTDSETHFKKEKAKSTRIRQTARIVSWCN